LQRGPSCSAGHLAARAVLQRGPSCSAGRLAARGGVHRTSSKQIKPASLSDPPILEMARNKHI
jgi:hypothetical protein